MLTLLRRILELTREETARHISIADADARLAKLMRDTPRPYYRPEWSKPSEKVRPA